MEKIKKFAHFKVNLNSPIVQMAHICERVDWFLEYTSYHDVKSIISEVADENVEMIVTDEGTSVEFYLRIGSVGTPNSQSIHLINGNDKFRGANMGTDHNRENVKKTIKLIWEYLEKFHNQNPTLPLIDRIDFVIQFQIKYVADQQDKIHGIIEESCERIKDMCDLEDLMIVDTLIGTIINSVNQKLYTIVFKF